MQTYKRAADLPSLTLVGAGPGDPELLTLKAVKALQSAKVVLYDSLVHPDILQYASSKAIKRFIGERAGRLVYTQEDINNMVVRYAKTYGHVVHLKGGDPFVFGRGYEEMVFAESARLRTAVIPGLTSATALPALQKIPLTTDSHNEGFWVLTGNTIEEKVSNEVFHAARTNATAVILMGLKKLGEIVEIYKEAGKADLPAAVIINGSMSNECFVTGKVKNIKEKINCQCLHGPALIIIGEAVSYYAEKKQQSFSPDKTKPLTMTNYENTFSLQTHVDI